MDVHSSGLENRVVGLAGCVEDSIRQVLPAHQDTVQVALSTAVGNVAPVLLWYFCVGNFVEILSNFENVGRSGWVGERGGVDSGMEGM